ncbi:hypothetical protein H072_8966 [Dactylellina haptotyla CBS 200.50]|uniref:Uncharacterized protein n=1 Tax=Dactylellina haptotyla (strain CBS 200.50) TaxID=1284197 RepID=S8BQ69_DACHA|nr:hypothetical protein H072_8966 [Dactylellina haptotyla CBS 200.50]
MAILPSWFSKDPKAGSPADIADAQKLPPPPPPVNPNPPVDPNPPAPPMPAAPVVLTEKQKYLKDMQYKVAVAGVILGPALIFMPPRKIDVYTVGLIFMTAFLTDHIMQEHGHRGLLYAISPQPSAEYVEKMRKSHARYEGMMPSEAIWAQLKDVWNQRYEDEVEEEKSEEKPESMLDRIRREEAEKPQSEVLKMLAEQEKKRKS